jgi:hypothetical protein
VESYCIRNFDRCGWVGRRTEDSWDFAMASVVGNLAVDSNCEGFVLSAAGEVDGEERRIAE